MTFALRILVLTLASIGVAALLTSVVVALMWKMIYQPGDDGALNRVLGVFGIEGKSWLGDFNLALPSVGLIGTWVYFGLAMVLLTAGVQKIPSSLYDAARVDGAGPFREFLVVTLPAMVGLPPTPVPAPAEATLGLQRPIEGDGRA